MDDPSSVNADIATQSMAIAALNGDAAFYDKVMAHLKTAKSPEEFYIYQGALTSFDDPALLQRTLDYALSPDARSQDSAGLIWSIMQHPLGQGLAWDFVRSHWSDIQKIGGAFGGGAEATVVSSTAAICDVGLRDQVKDFFAAHPVPSAARTLKQALERINSCIDLKDQQRPQLSSWLRRQTGSAGIH